MNSTNEFQVVKSGQVRLKSAAERQRPGDAHPSRDVTGCRFLGTTDEPDQGRFAGTVLTEDAEVPAALQAKIHAVENRPRAKSRGVNLTDVFYRDHRSCAFWPALRTR